MQRVAGAVLRGGARSLTSSSHPPAPPTSLPSSDAASPAELLAVIQQRRKRAAQGKKASPPRVEALPNAALRADLRKAAAALRGVAARSGVAAASAAAGGGGFGASSPSMPLLDMAETLALKAVQSHLPRDLSSGDARRLAVVLRQLVEVRPIVDATVHSDMIRAACVASVSAGFRKQDLLQFIDSVMALAAKQFERNALPLIERLIPLYVNTCLSLDEPSTLVKVKRMILGIQLPEAYDYTLHCAFERMTLKLHTIYDMWSGKAVKYTKKYVITKTGRKSVVFTQTSRYHMSVLHKLDAVFEGMEQVFGAFEVKSFGMDEPSTPMHLGVFDPKTDSIMAVSKDVNCFFRVESMSDNFEENFGDVVSGMHSTQRSKKAKKGNATAAAEDAAPADAAQPTPSDADVSASPSQLPVADEETSVREAVAELLDSPPTVYDMSSIIVEQRIVGAHPTETLWVPTHWEDLYILGSEDDMLEAPVAGRYKKLFRKRIKIPKDIRDLESQQEFEAPDLEDVEGRHGKHRE